MTGASLYNAFGDKRTLYRRVLDHYVERSFGDRVERFEGSLPPRAAIDAFFKEIVEASLSDKQRKGCMLVNSALELAPHDPDFQRAIAKVLVRVEAFSAVACWRASMPALSRARRAPKIWRGFCWACCWHFGCWRGCALSGSCWKDC